MSQSRGRDVRPFVVNRSRCQSVASSSSDEDEEYYPEVRASVMEMPPPEQIFAGMPARKVVDCYTRAGYPSIHLPWLQSTPRNSQLASELDIARKAHSEFSDAACQHIQAGGSLGVSVAQLIAAMEGLAKSWAREGRHARKTKLFGDGGLQICGELVARWHAGRLKSADHESLARLYPCTESGRKKLYDDVQALRHDSAVQSANASFARQLVGPKEEGTAPGCFAHEDMPGGGSSDSAPEDNCAGFRNYHRTSRTSSKQMHPAKLHPLGVSPRRRSMGRATSNSSSASRRKNKNPSFVCDSPRSSRH